MEEATSNPQIRKLSVDLTYLEKAIYEDEKNEEEAKMSDNEQNEELDEKWIKTKSLTKAHMLPIELPLERGMDEEDLALDILEALNRGELQILQLPPNTFEGDFLAEKEVDEQELESIEVEYYHSELKLPRQEQHFEAFGQY